MNTITLDTGLAVLARRQAGEWYADSFTDADAAYAVLEGLGVAWMIFHDEAAGLFYICRRNDICAWRLKREADMIGKLPANKRARALALLRHGHHQGNPYHANSSSAI
jgi:hypothetical protein